MIFDIFDVISLAIFVGPPCILLWALYALGSAGRGAAWWGMAGTTTAPLLLALCRGIDLVPGVKLRGVNFVIHHPDCLFGAAAVVFGACFIRYAQYLAKELRALRALEHRCDSMAAVASFLQPAPTSESFK